MLKKENPEVTAAVDRLWQHVSPCERGFLLTLETIDALICAPRRTNFWNAVFVKFKRRMLSERRIELNSEHGLGYVLATAADQLRRGVDKHDNRARRQHWRAWLVLKAVPVEDLSEHERNYHASKASSTKDQYYGARTQRQRNNAILSPRVKTVKHRHQPVQQRRRMPALPAGHQVGFG